MAATAEDTVEWITDRVKSGVYYKKLADDNKFLHKEVKRLSMNAANEMRKNHAEMSRYKSAISHYQSGLKLWIPRDQEKWERTVREMEQVQERVEEILDG